MGRAFFEPPKGGESTLAKDGVKSGISTNLFEPTLMEYYGAQDKGGGE